MHSPFPPTLMESCLMPPFLMSSANDIVGYAALKASTARLHATGMAVLTVGLLACAAVGPDARGAFPGAVLLKNFASGHVSIMSMVQSSTHQPYYRPRQARSRGGCW